VTPEFHPPRESFRGWVYCSRFFDHVLRNLSGLISLSSEGMGRQVSEGVVGSLGVELGLRMPEFLGCGFIGLTP